MTNYNTTKLSYDIIIAGGGASSMFCAIKLKLLSPQITIAILERNNSLGKKLLLTGNGRCNISNSAIDVNKYYSDDMDKLIDIYQSFDNQELVSFFENIAGVPLTSKNSCLYPSTFKSSTINDSLIQLLDELNVDIHLSTTINRIFSQEQLFKVKTNNGEFESSKIIFAMGGLSYPKTGSDGQAFRLLCEKYLTKNDIKAPLPSLVQLKTNNRNFHKLAGIKVHTVCSLFDSSAKSKEEISTLSIDTTSKMTKNNLLAMEEGELLFTDYGLSGIQIMQLSGIANRFYRQNRYFPELRIDFSNNKKEYMLKNLNVFTKRSIKDALSGIIYTQLLMVILDEAKINPDTPVNKLNNSTQNKLINLITNHKFNITGTLDFNSAQVTTGGVKLSLLDDNLMLKSQDGLYIIGEAVNVDGPCGGYNLQWAFSSAFRCARGIFDGI